MFYKKTWTPSYQTRISHVRSRSKLVYLPWFYFLYIRLICFTGDQSSIESTISKGYCIHSRFRTVCCSSLEFNIQDLVITIWSRSQVQGKNQRCVENYLILNKFSRVAQFLVFWERRKKYASSRFWLRCTLPVYMQDSNFQDSYCSDYRAKIIFKIAIAKIAWRQKVSNLLLPILLD